MRPELIKAVDLKLITEDEASHIEDERDRAAYKAIIDELADFLSDDFTTRETHTIAEWIIFHRTTVRQFIDQAGPQ